MVVRSDYLDMAAINATRSTRTRVGENGLGLDQWIAIFLYNHWHDASETEFRKSFIYGLNI